MAIVATVENVEDLIGRSLTADSARVGRLLDRVEGIIVGEMPGLTFGPVTFTDVEVAGTGESVLTLPYYPVTAVSSVVIEGTVLDPSEYRVNVLGHLTRYSSQIANPHDSGRVEVRWPDAGTVVVIGFDAGWAASTVPAVFTAVAAEMVRDTMANPEQVVQESIGDRSHTFVNPAGGGDLTGGQRHRLRHWNRNRVASVRVRT